MLVVLSVVSALLLRVSRQELATEFEHSDGHTEWRKRSTRRVEHEVRSVRTSCEGHPRFLHGPTVSSRDSRRGSDGLGMPTRRERPMPDRDRTQAESLPRRG
jgi:hypothetical protein